LRPRTAMNNATTAGTKYCHACGKSIDARAEICPHCGVRQHAPPASSPFGTNTPSARNRIAAGLFGILLGTIGVHKFYLGSVGLGVLYLIFFWTGIPTIVGIIEGIIYLTMTDQEFAAKYG